MFDVGTKVLYKTSGVCTVTEIKKAKISELSGEKVYYILKPINDPNFTIYVPTDNEALTSQMREILTADEIIALIKSMPHEDTEWISDSKQRSDLFRKILIGGDRKELMKMTKTIHRKRQELAEIGKKLYAADESALKKAERVLFDEFALVLKIRQEDVIPFIIGQIECEQK